MRAALIPRDRVNLVHDDGARSLQHFSAALGRQENVERFGRRDEDVGAFFEHEPALARGRVAGAHRHANLRQFHALFLRKRANLAQRFLQVLLDVVAERLQGRDVDEAAFVIEFARERVANQPVERPQEGGQRLSRARGRGDERVASGGDFGPARILGSARLREFFTEPARDQRMKGVSVHSGGILPQTGRDGRRV